MEKPRLPKKLLSPLDYPLVIKAELGSLKIYSPDFKIATAALADLSLVPLAERKSYYQSVGAEVMRAWSKIQAAQKAMASQGKELPDPSDGFLPIAKGSREERLSPRDVAELMGCHVDTVRRAIDRGELKSRLTPGGHRRVLESDAREWLKAAPQRSPGRPSAGGS
jgi:excisionase family DNA binding protein